MSLLTKVRRQAEPGLECLADKARAIVTPVELRRGQGAGFYVNQSLFQGAGPRRESVYCRQAILSFSTVLSLQDYIATSDESSQTFLRPALFKEEKCTV